MVGPALVRVNNVSRILQRKSANIRSVTLARRKPARKSSPFPNQLDDKKVPCRN